MKSIALLLTIGIFVNFANAQFSMQNVYYKSDTVTCSNGVLTTLSNYKEPTMVITYSNQTGTCNQYASTNDKCDSSTSAGQTVIAVSTCYSGAIRDYVTRDLTTPDTIKFAHFTVSRFDDCVVRQNLNVAAYTDLNSLSDAHIFLPLTGTNTQIVSWAGKFNYIDCKSGATSGKFGCTDQGLNGCTELTSQCVKPSGSTLYQKATCPASWANSLQYSTATVLLSLLISVGSIIVL